MSWWLTLPYLFACGWIVVVVGVALYALTRKSKQRRAWQPSPARFKLRDLAQRLSLDAIYLQRFIAGYTPVTVQKRGKGWRTLQVPDGPTMQLQRRVLRRLLGKLEAHPLAFGFERGRSIADHAALHSGKAIVVKCDIVDFFPSTSSRRIGELFSRLGWDDECVAILTRICCHDGGLPQGAPTSPKLSNLVNRGFDTLMHDFATRNKIAYSRYADDLCFSFAYEHQPTGAKKVRGVLQFARSVCKTYGYQLHGRDKTRIARHHQRQIVCGLVVNDKPNLPREVRRKLRAVRHHHDTGRPGTMSGEQLKGWSAYEAMVKSAQQSSDE